MIKRASLIIMCMLSMSAMAQDAVEADLESSTEESTLADVISENSAEQSGSENSEQSLTSDVDSKENQIATSELAASADEAPEAPVAPAAQDAQPAPVAPEARRAPTGGTEVVNLSATIVGNQEQPTVLYIVPWKQAEDTTILYLPLSSKAMEHVFGHVERVEHQRQVQYIDQLDK